MPQAADAKRPKLACGGPPLGELSGGNWMAPRARAPVLGRAPAQGAVALRRPDLPTTRPSGPPRDARGPHRPRSSAASG